MINLFRKIRKQLAADNKPKKYLRYAIGEILLVVIGILIALQLNNLNELRKNEKRIISSLNIVLEELSENILKSNFILDEFIRMDSLKNLVFNNQLTIDDYKIRQVDDKELIIYWFKNFLIHANGYNNLIREIDYFPDKYVFIIEKLNLLYVTYKGSVDGFNIRLQNTVYDNIDYLYQNKPWYKIDIFQGKLSDDQIDYYLYDEYYKVQVARTMNDMVNTYIAATKFRKDAIDTYKTIAKLIVSDRDTPRHINYTLNNDDIPNHYIGHYQLAERPENALLGNALEIIHNGNQFFANSEKGGLIPLYYYKNTIFFVYGNSNIFTFNKEKKGELTIINGYTRLSRWTKITKN